MASRIKALKVLRCLTCAGQFSWSDVEEGRYFASTGICLGCYQQMRSTPGRVSCFGKHSKIVKGKPVYYGWEAGAVECKSECPDRAICKLFVKGVLE